MGLYDDLIPASSTPSPAPAQPVLSATPTPAPAPLPAASTKITTSTPAIAPQPKAQNPAPQPATPTPQPQSQKTIYDDLIPNSTASGPASTPNPTPTKTIYDDLIPSKSTPSPYFSTVDEKGNSIGFSDQKDVAGKPFLAYRNPGDTATTTDKTRVATSFDPRKAQKLEPKLVQNGRLAESASSAIKKELGGSYSDELDHRIALELAGSNDRENLGLEPDVPGTHNTATDPLENSLARDVASGKTSLWDAQVKLAQAKGIKVPWTAQAKSPGFWDTLKGALGTAGKDIGDTLENVKNFFTGNQAAAETTPNTPDAFKTKVTGTFPFTDAAKSIINKIPIALGDPANKNAPSQTEYGPGNKPSQILINGMSTPDDQLHLAHEFFNTIFSQDKIDPAAFNKAWDQALKSGGDGATQLKNIDDKTLNAPGNAPVFKGKFGENINDPFYQATERFALAGSMLGVDGISSIPKALQPFYKNYLADYQDTGAGPKMNFDTGQTLSQENPKNLKSSDTMSEDFSRPYGAPGGGGAPAINQKLIGEDNPTAGPFVKFSKDVYNSASNSLNTAGNSIMDIMRAWSPANHDPGAVSDKISSTLNTVGATLNLIPEWQAFSSTLKGAENLPAIGPLAQVVNFAFGKVGQAASTVSNATIDALPVSDVAKANLKPAVGQLSALVAQMVTALSLHATSEDVMSRIKETQMNAFEKQANGATLTKAENLSLKLAETQTKIKNALVSGYEKAKHIPEALNAIPNKQGGFVKNPLAGNEAEPKSDETKKPEETPNTVYRYQGGEKGDLNKALEKNGIPTVGQGHYYTEKPDGEATEFGTTRTIHEVPSNLNLYDTTATSKGDTFTGISNDPLYRGMLKAGQSDFVAYVKTQGYDGVRFFSDDGSEKWIATADPLKEVATPTKKETQNVPIEQVKSGLSPGLESRMNPKAPKIKEMTDHLKGGGELPPVPVHQLPDGTYQLNDDGAHRLVAHREAGRKTIPVRIEEKNTLPAATKQATERARVANKNAEEAENHAIEQVKNGETDPVKLATDLKIKFNLPAEKATKISAQIVKDAGPQKPLEEPGSGTQGKRSFSQEDQKIPIPQEYKSLGENIEKAKAGNIPHKWERIPSGHFPTEIEKSGLPSELKTTRGNIEDIITDHKYFPTGAYLQTVHTPDVVIAFPPDDRGVERINAIKTINGRPYLVGAKRVNGYNTTTHFKITDESEPAKLQKYLQSLLDKGGKIVYQAGGARTLFTSLQAVEPEAQNPKLGAKGSGGTPGENRTRNTSVRTGSVVPSNRDIGTLPQDEKIVKSLPAEIRPDYKETEKGLKEEQKLAATEAKNAPTPLKQHLDSLVAERANFRDVLNNHPAKELMKYVNRKTGELPEALGTGRSKFGKVGDELASELGYKNSEDARTAAQDYMLKQKQLSNLNDEIRTARQLNARASHEDAEAKSLNAILNKTATKTDIEIAKKQRVEDIKKAEQKTQEELKRMAAEDAAYRKKIQAAHETSEKTKGVIGKIKKALYPSKALDVETQPIVETWFQGIINSKQSGLEAFNDAVKKGPQNFQEIIDFQAGKQTNYIREAFDTMGTDFKRRGLSFGWKDNYMPDVWKDSPRRQLAARAAFLKEKGMTPEEIAAYEKGVPLNESTALRLKLRPNFVKDRFWPDYKTGMAHGLTPKYHTPADLIGYYKEAGERALNAKNFLETLKKEAKLLSPEQAPDTWRFVSSRFAGREVLKAAPNLADFIEGKFRDDDHLTLYETGVQAVKNVSRFMQDMVVSGGVPGTVLHPFGFAQATRIATTMLGDAATGRFHDVVTDLKASFAIIRANSNTASMKWFAEKEGTIAMMARNGIDLTDRVGGRGWKNLYQSLAETRSEDKGIAGTAKTTLNAAKVVFDKAIPEKAFRSMMPQLKVVIFEGAYKAAISHGMDPAEAEKIAAETTKKSEGMIEETGRSKTTKDTLGSLFFAPPYRESLVNIFTNAAKGLTTEFNNPAYARNRSFLVGLIATFAAMQALNYKINGTSTFQNPNGRKLSLRIPLPNNDVIYYDLGPGLITVPRNLAEGAIALGHGDFNTAKQKAGSALSMPFQVLTQLWANKDYFGNDIYKATDSGSVAIQKMAAYVGTEASHPYIAQLYKYFSGSQDGFTSFIAALGLPIKLTNTVKEANSDISGAIDAQVKSAADLKTKATNLYNTLKGQPDAAAEWEKINQTDPTLAAKIAEIANTQKLPGSERSLKILQVKDGSRAKEIYSLIMKMPAGERADYYSKLVDDKIITETVAGQISDLKAADTSGQ